MHTMTMHASALAISTDSYTLKSVCSISHSERVHTFQKQARVNGAKEKYHSKTVMINTSLSH